MWPARSPRRAPSCACSSARAATSPGLEGVPGETHVGDLAEPESLRPALAGCDAVVHVAADYRLWIRDPAAMYRANVEGTRELLRWPARPGSAVRLHLQRGDHALSRRRPCHDEDTPVGIATWWATTSAPSFWPSRRPWPPPRRPAGHHPEPHDPHRPERRQAHARPAGSCGFSQRQVPRLHGHRPQPRRRGEVARTHAAALTRGARAAATSWAARTSP
jgi:dihydroflavonol-4-reductase